MNFSYFIGIVTILADNVKNLEGMHGVDLSFTLLTLANLIVRYHDPASHRLKLKLCALCESVFDPTEGISMREDSVTRQSIVDFIIEWVQGLLNVGTWSCTSFRISDLVVDAK